MGEMNWTTTPLFDLGLNLLKIYSTTFSTACSTT